MRNYVEIQFVTWSFTYGVGFGNEYTFPGLDLDDCYEFYRYARNLGLWSDIRDESFAEFSRYMKVDRKNFIRMWKYVAWFHNSSLPQTFDSQPDSSHPEFMQFRSKMWSPETFRKREKRKFKLVPIKSR